MKKLQEWFGLVKDADGDGGDMVAGLTAAVACYQEALSEAGVSSSHFSVYTVGDADGDADGDNEAALYCVSDSYADWYVYVDGAGGATLIAYYSYGYDCVCCSADVVEFVDKEALTKAASREERDSILKAYKKKKPQPVYKVVKSADEAKYTLGVAYAAGELDAHEDYQTAEDLEQTAWDFMRSGNAILKGAGADHAAGTDLEGTVVESYIYRGPDWEVSGQIVKSGDWLLGVVWSDEVWDSIKKGERTGYSIQGWGKKQPVVEEEIAA